MKKTFARTAAAFGLCLALIGGTTVGAAVPFGGSPGMPGTRSFPEESPIVENRSAPETQLLICEPGEYTLAGDMRGTVLVDPGEGEVRLILDGAQIDGANGPAIIALSGERLELELEKDSANVMHASPDPSFGAAIFSEVPVVIGGEGRLDMTARGADAIRVENGGLSFEGGEIRIQADGIGLNAAEISFGGGAVFLDAGRGGILPGAETQMNGGQLDAEWNRPDGFTSGIQSTGTSTVSQTNGGSQQNDGKKQAAGGSQRTDDPAQNGQSSGLPTGQPGSAAAQSTVNQAGDLAAGITENSAMSLTADYENAITYDVSEDGVVKITDSGTYIVTGTASEGSITVKKGTTGVILILDNLDLTSTSGAVLSVNKEAEVQIIVSGNVTLTDNENPDDENSADADVADAYDGAAIKIKAGSVAFITGDGTLTVNGNAKNGIKAGDDTSLIIGGDLTVSINAVNDGINGNYDVSILGGTVTISAGDDGIHADHILTIGDSETGEGPVLTVTESAEGLEGTVVNIAGGKINVRASDDGINAANGDGLYEDELVYSVNITGGETTVNAGGDGIDSNGDVNLIGGSLSIRSANNSGEAGIDYDGELYIADGYRLDNQSGVAGPDGMPGEMGGAPGGMNPGSQGGFSGEMGGFGPGR